MEPKTYRIVKREEKISATIDFKIFEMQELKKKLIIPAIVLRRMTIEICIPNIIIKFYV